MSLSEKPSYGQLMAMVMIGAGLIAIGIMLFLLLNTAHPPRTFRLFL
jgi:uncharacterized membrane protein